MGGKGSGRYFHFGTRATTEDYPSIDVRHWQRDGLLIPYQRVKNLIGGAFGKGVVIYLPDNGRNPELSESAIPESELPQR